MQQKKRHKASKHVRTRPPCLQMICRDFLGASSPLCRRWEHLAAVPCLDAQLLKGSELCRQPQTGSGKNTTAIFDLSSSKIRFGEQYCLLLERLDNASRVLRELVKSQTQEVLTLLMMQKGTFTGFYFFF